MRPNDYIRSELIAIEHCPVRDICPIKGLCNATDETGVELLPYQGSVAKDELLWTDLRNEQRITIIRSGVFAAVAMDDNDNENIFALYGAGYIIGLAELYIPREVGSTYYLKALTDCAVCSIPAKPLRRRLESLPTSDVAELISCSITNWSASSFQLLKLYGHTQVYERVLLFLALVREQWARSGAAALNEIALSHDELAFLVSAERVSVTRALHRAESEGLIYLGYKRISINPAFDDRLTEISKHHLAFHNPAK